MPYGITVLHATWHRCESYLYTQSKQVLDLAALEGCKAGSASVMWKQTGGDMNPRPVNHKFIALPHNTYHFSPVNGASDYF